MGELADTIVVPFFRIGTRPRTADWHIFPTIIGIDYIEGRCTPAILISAHSRQNLGLAPIGHDMKYRQGSRVIHIRTNIRVKDNPNRLPGIQRSAIPAASKQYPN
jgi:hypothetical protein